MVLALLYARIALSWPSVVVLSFWAHNTILSSYSLLPDQTHYGWPSFPLQGPLPAHQESASLSCHPVTSPGSLYSPVSCHF